MYATPDAYRYAIERAKEAIGQLDWEIDVTRADGMPAGSPWLRAREAERAQFVRQLEALEEALARAQRLWAAAQQQGGGRRSGTEQEQKGERRSDPESEAIVRNCIHLWEVWAWNVAHRSDAPGQINIHAQCTFCGTVSEGSAPLGARVCAVLPGVGALAPT